MRAYFYIVQTIICSSLLFAQIPKSELYEYVINAPNTKKLDNLVSYLKEGASNQKELAELLAYWMMENIAYDTDGFSSGKYQSSDWEVTYSTKKAVCAGYAKLYKELCIRADIHCEIVSGYAKGFNHKRGSNFERSNHAWNLIDIEGKRFLMDVTWASGGVGYQNGQLKFEKYFKPELLFCKPESFIEKHLPNQRRWQLLSFPIAYDDFTKYDTYEAMVDSSMTYYNFQDSIDAYLNLDDINQRVNDTQETRFVHSGNSDLPIHFEIIAYELSQNTSSIEKLEEAKKHYITAKQLYVKTADKKRCDNGIAYIDYYLNKL